MELGLKLGLELELKEWNRVRGKAGMETIFRELDFEELNRARGIVWKYMSE